MILDWIKMVRDAGIDAGRLSVSELYEVSTRLLNDSVVKPRRLAKMVNGRIPMGAAASVIAEMTKTEREELRKRISN